MLAEQVRAYRRRLGLTQEELAGTTGLSVRTIRKIEAGRTGTPRPATVRLLADAFGLAGAEREQFCVIAGGAAETDQPAGPRVPAQLPGDVSAFTGRGEQLAWLDTLMATASGQPAAGIAVLSGTAGVGNTAPEKVTQIR